MDRSAFASKLQLLSPLDDDSLAAVNELEMRCVNAPRRAELIEEGHCPTSVQILCTGWAASYSRRPNGYRRITALYLPGDIISIHALYGASIEYNIATLADCTIGHVKPAAFRSLMDRHGSIEEAVTRSQLINDATLRKWLLVSGDAYLSMAHLFCEIAIRTMQRGRLASDPINFPATQDELGDALGLTAVHVNRTIKRLREDGLAAMRYGELHISDFSGLAKAARFNAEYLRPDPRT